MPDLTTKLTRACQTSHFYQSIHRLVPHNAMSTADAIRVERPTTSSKLFAHTRWDAVPAAAGLLHLAYLFGLYLLFPHVPLWVMLVLGFIYSLMVNANINGVGHNFIRNPFFRSQLLNRVFGVTQS